MEGLAEAFEKVVGLALADGENRLDLHDGLWERNVGAWKIKLNPHMETVDGVAPYSAHLEYNGFPAGVVSPAGGIIAAGEAANEDSFIAAVLAEVASMGIEYATLWEG